MQYHLVRSLIMHSDYKILVSSRSRTNTNDSDTCLYLIFQAYSAIFDRRMKSNWFRESEPDSRSQSALVYNWTVVTFTSKPTLISVLGVDTWSQVL